MSAVTGLDRSENRHDFGGNGGLHKAIVPATAFLGLCGRRFGTEASVTRRHAQVKAGGTATNSATLSKDEDRRRTPCRRL